MAHSLYETRLQGILVVVFIKRTIQFNPSRRSLLRELAVAMSRSSAYNHKE